MPESPGVLRRGFCVSLLLICTQALPQSAVPDKPVRIVVSTPAGGPIDALARILGEGVGRQLKQTVIVENRAGGTGAIALGHVARQAPDGYTVVITANAAFALTPLVRKMPYRPLEDFSFVGRLAFTPDVFVVPATSTVRSMQELVAQAKAQPGKLNYGMMLGVSQHLDFERFKKDAGIDIVLVPYTGGAPIANGLLGGQVQVTLLNAPLFFEWAKAGKVRLLATSARARAAALPDLPTLAEAGLPQVGLSGGSFYSLAAPAGLPPAVATRLFPAFSAAAAEPALRAKLEALGFEISLRDGDALKQDLQREIADYEKLVKALGIKLID